MRTKNLVLLAQMYRYWAVKHAVETTGNVKQLGELETFKDRIDYAEKHWKHLSSGSSRVIYLLDDGHVLKLAKNKKGLAQNLAESNPEMKSKFINSTLEWDKEGVWKTSPYVDKVTEKEFEEMTGLNFKEFGDALEYGLREVSSDASEEKPKGFDKIKKSPMYQDLVRVAKKCQLMPGDMSRISSFGHKDGHPVLIDAGLTKKIFDEFYE